MAGPYTGDRHQLPRGPQVQRALAVLAKPEVVELAREATRRMLADGRITLVPNAERTAVRALVLCDSGGLGPPPDEGSKVYIKKFVTLFGSGVRGDPEFAAAFEQYYRTVLIEEPARAERDRIVRAAYEVAPVLVQAWQSFARPEESLQSLLPQIQTPVLLAWARDDAIITLRSGAIAYTQFPNARLEVFAGGHAVFLEDPDRFEKELRRFIGTH